MRRLLTITDAADTRIRPGRGEGFCYRRSVMDVLLRFGFPTSGGVVGILCALSLGLGCNSDLRLQESETGTSTSTTTGTTTTTTTTTSTSTSTTGDETTGSDTTGPEQSCRDALQCIGLCAAQLDIQCIQECAMDLPPDEGQKALQLGLCIGMQCFGGGSCTIDDPMSQECVACIALSLFSPKPPGCEEQAAACM